MGISLDKLVGLAGSATAKRGYDYFFENRVDITYLSEDEVHAEVAGSRGDYYDVEIQYRDFTCSAIEYAHCSCPSFGASTEMCKHIVATALESAAIEDFDDGFDDEVPLWLSDPDDLFAQNEEPRQEKAKETSQAAKSLIQNYAQRIANENHPRITVPDLASIECILHYDDRGYSYYYQDDTYLTFKAGTKKLYVIKDVQEFAIGFTYHEVLQLGKNNSVVLDYSAFVPESHAILDFIRSNYNRFHTRHAYRSGLRKALYLDRRALDEFFGIMDGRQMKLERSSGRQRTCTARHANPRISLVLAEEPPGYTLSATEFDGYISGAEHFYVLKGANLYRCDEGYSNSCRDLLYSLHHSGSQYCAVQDMPALLSSVIPSVKPFIDVAMPESVYRYLPEPLVVKVYFDLDEYDGVLAHMTFSYGDDTFDAFAAKVSTQSLDLPSEMKAEYLVSRYMGDVLAAPGTLVLEDEEAIYNLLTEGFEAIEEVAEVYVSEGFNKLKVHPSVDVSVGVRIEGRLLEIDIDLEGMDFNELADVINSYKRVRRYHRLKDGSFLALQDGALAHIAEISDTLMLSSKDLVEGPISLDINRAFYLDAMFKKNEELRYTRDNSFKEIIRRMHNVEDAEFEAPAQLRNVLRNYQLAGYQWLRTLHYLHFGGILADDMGLGKTLQVLALLQALKDKRCSIVVCPASLVYNWQIEAGRFTPDLTICVVAGPAAEREALIADHASYDVLVTSYDLLKRDIEHYGPVEFSYIILDEAHYIKNQATQSAKAVKLLKGSDRLALTGTPIENSLAELWSVFDFLMPGYLYGYTKFKQNYETAITKYKDDAKTERLRSLVRPFVLRRIKSDVLKELPEKMEQVQSVKLGDRQQKVYMATLAQTKKELSKQLEEAGAGQSRILMLAALTRLRQICCDPSLVFDNYDGGSAKLEMCMDIVRSAIEGGHRILIFSQFTSMLAIIKEQLQAEGIEHYLLQGSTPKVERIKLVEQFNTNEIPIFLISLKAGGTGLNLTGADMVIHYDPWWNLSAQNQATDRTHRIGQSKRVQVYKLIAKDTIEERIVKLQEAKAELAESIIQKGDTVFDSLTSEEIASLFEG